MKTSFELWVAMVVNQVICTTLLCVITAVSSYLLFLEYRNLETNDDSAWQPSSDSRRTRMRLRTESGASGSSGDKSDNSRTGESSVRSSQPSSPRQRSGSKSLSSSKKSNRYLIIHAAKALAVCLSFLINNLLDLLSLFGLVSCNLRSVIGSPSFQLGKLITITIFVDRIGLVYRHSVYEYSKRTLRVIYSVAIVLSVLFMTLWVIYSDPYPQRVRGSNKGRVCVAASKHLIIPALLLITEWCLEIMTLKMFTSPLRQMCKMSNEMDESTLAMARLARKTTVLSYVMAGVMFVSVLVMALSQNYMAGRPASVIYCVSLLLFPQWFDDWYPSLCAGPIFLSKQCCSIPKHSAKQVINSMKSKVTSMSSVNIADETTET